MIQLKGIWPVFYDNEDKIIRVEDQNRVFYNQDNDLFLLDQDCWFLKLEELDGFLGIHASKDLDISGMYSAFDAKIKDYEDSLDLDIVE